MRNSERSDRINFQNLQKTLNEGLSTLQFNFEYSVIVIGRSGTGKSSIINTLIGNTLIVQVRNKRLSIVNLTVAQGQTGPKIGNTASSQTTVPHPWKDKNGIVYWDCPGFDDNKGVQQDICNALFIQKIFMQSKKIKILLAFSQNDFNSQRLISITDMIKRLTIFFPNLQQVFKGICIVVTKCGPQVQGAQFNEQFEQILSDIKRISEKQRQFYNFLKQNSKQIISCFPNPLLNKSQVLNQTSTNDIKRVLNKINYINSLKVTPLISQKSKVALYQFVDNSQQGIKKHFIQLYKQISKYFYQYMQIQTVKDLKCFLYIYKSLQDNLQDIIATQKQIAKDDYQRYSKYFYRLRQNIQQRIYKQKEKNCKIVSYVKFMMCCKNIINMKKSITQIAFSFIYDIKGVTDEIYLTMLQYSAQNGRNKLQKVKKKMTNIIKNTKIKQIYLKQSKNSLQKLSKQVKQKSNSQILRQLLKIFSKLNIQQDKRLSQYIKQLYEHLQIVDILSKRLNELNNDFKKQQIIIFLAQFTKIINDQFYSVNLSSTEQRIRSSYSSYGLGKYRNSLY